MSSLQKNLCDNKTGPILYEKMFVWNEYLTRGIRNSLKNTLWTVALVYGFFKQVRTLIASVALLITGNLVISYQSMPELLLHLNFLQFAIFVLVCVSLFYPFSKSENLGDVTFCIW